MTTFSTLDLTTMSIYILIKSFHPPLLLYLNFTFICICIRHHPFIFSWFHGSFSVYSWTLSIYPTVHKQLREPFSGNMLFLTLIIFTYVYLIFRSMAWPIQLELDQFDLISFCLSSLISNVNSVVPWGWWKQGTHCVHWLKHWDRTKC